jgi:type I restriction enzyme, S subunit
MTRWPRISLGNVCLPTVICDPREKPHKLFRYLDISSIDRVQKVISGTLEIVGAEAPSRARKEIKQGDILVSTVRPNLNAVAVVPADLDGQIASTGFCVLRPNPKLINGRYLFYYTICSEFVNTLTAAVRGAHYPAVSDGDVKKISMPLPPLFEQQRIVEILDQANGLRKKRAEANAKAERILPALFYKLFGDPVKNGRNCEVHVLGEILEDIDSGWSPICLERAARSEEWGVLKLGAVTSCHFREEENKALPDGTEPEPDLEVKAGDLLLSRKNTLELVAACAYVYDTRPRLMLSDLIFRLRLRRDAKVLSQYLWGLLTHPGKRKQLRSLATGSAGSMPNISKERLRSLRIEVPDLSLQRKFAALTPKSHYLDLNRLESHHRLEHLFQSLLQRAFSGRLTSQWRESRMRELLAEMEEQSKALEPPRTIEAD